MSTGLNKFLGIGNLCADPELRQTGSGSAVCNLRLAINERRKVQGEWVDHVEYVSIVAFGKTAENVNRYCRKGRQVYVEGRLQTRKWQDKNGADRWSTEIVADVVKFLGRGEGEGRQERGGGYGGNQGGGSRGGYGGGGSYGSGGGAQVPHTDDIPF